MKKLLMLLALVASVALVAGCAGPGELRKISLTMPRGEKATIVAHNQLAPDWMLDRDRLAINFMVRGDVSAEQLQAVAAVEGACRVYTGTVRPNNLVAVLSQGIAYGIGGTAVGAGATFFPGVNALQYLGYGALAGTGAGIINGVVTLGGQTYTFENCSREAFGLFPDYGVRVLNKSPY